MNIVGKTVKEVRYPSQYENITILFTDGTTLEVREHGQVGELKVFVNNQEISSEIFPVTKKNGHEFLDELNSRKPPVFGLSESMKKICEERGIPFIDISDDSLNG